MDYEYGIKYKFLLFVVIIAYTYIWLLKYLPLLDEVLELIIYIIDLTKFEDDTTQLLTKKAKQHSF